MKNVLLSFFSAFLLLSGISASAQVTTFNGKDSATGYYSGGTELIVANDLKSSTGSPVTLKWHVANSYFGTGWELMGSGFCDNVLCYTAVTSNNIFSNPSLVQTTDAYTTSAFGEFHMVFNVSTAPPAGSYAWVQVVVEDVANSSATKTLTFVANASTTGITTTSSSDDVVVFPNPARDVVNVVFNSKSDVKTIAVYNLIGKLVSPIYRPATNNSAKIEVNDMPSGVYFIRLSDGKGHVVATRRFVH